MSGSGWQWALHDDHAAQGRQGEIQLDIALDSTILLVTRHYVIYPGTSVIREWSTLDNISGHSVNLSHVDFFHAQVLASTAKDLQFNYLTGGGNYNGSQLLKSEPMSQEYKRTLDSNGRNTAG